VSADNWTHTWDGQPIAADAPQGSCVHVRRRNDAGDLEVLLLHRAHHGPDFAGDWAWTSPAGARQPGEAVYAGAVRELAEEAGIAAPELWPIDLSGRWALFVADVPADTAIVLVDPEHDRWEWVSPEVAAERALPAVVGGQFAKAARSRAGGVSFAPLRLDDMADVVRWQQAPHAREWFAGGPATVEQAEEHYGPRIEGKSSIRMWRVDIEGTAAGYIQAYPVGADEEYAVKTRDPDAVAFDYVIGEESLAGRGWGRAMIWAFLRQVLMPEYPTAPRFLASPDHRNQPSLRVLEACGFTPGLWIDVPPRPGEPPATEIVCTLDREHWFGAS
jgi:8-oxo-dGTP pyrophosphatase MutT (NUDIX family)/RimJ/RimL family protein N-acetyltransferase